MTTEQKIFIAFITVFVMLYITTLGLSAYFNKTETTNDLVQSCLDAGGEPRWVDWEKDCEVTLDGGDYKCVTQMCLIKK